MLKRELLPNLIDFYKKEEEKEAEEEKTGNALAENFIMYRSGGDWKYKETNARLRSHNFSRRLTLAMTSAFRKIQKQPNE